MKYQSEAAARQRNESDRSSSSPAGRATSISRITEVAPIVRKIFEVRPTGQEREKWMSLTAHQLEALTALSGRSATMGELCQRIDISESAGTALSDRLVAHGMVVRESDPSDRRIVRLSLSSEARAMVERFRELKRARIEEVLSALDDHELEALAGIYERLVAGAQYGTPGSPAPKAAIARRSERRLSTAEAGRGR
ncbi:MAG: MarR family transcriptional regulator [Actinomycetota bacterium]|nr:MarR family transcriptional regulator [Actinomycetota bacterium]